MTISASDVSEEFLGSVFDAFETEKLRDVQSILSDMFHSRKPIDQDVARKLLKIVLATVNTEMERPENADEDEDFEDD